MPLDSTYNIHCGSLGIAPENRPLRLSQTHKEERGIPPGQQANQLRAWPPRLKRHWAMCTIRVRRSDGSSVAARLEGVASARSRHEVDRRRRVRLDLAPQPEDDLPQRAVGILVAGAAQVAE